MSPLELYLAVWMAIVTGVWFPILIMDGVRGLYRKYQQRKRRQVMTGSKRRKRP